MFCFPISDQVMVPQRTVSFKCRPMHMHPYACVCVISKKANFLENRLGYYKGISVWNFWQPYFHCPQVTRCYLQEVLWTSLCSSKWCKQMSGSDKQTTSEKKNSSACAICPVYYNGMLSIAWCITLWGVLLMLKPGQLIVNPIWEFCYDYDNTCMYCIRKQYIKSLFL